MSLGRLFPKKVVLLVKRHLKELLKQSHPIPRPLADNIQLLGASVGLNEDEQTLLAFVVLLKAFRSMQTAATNVSCHGQKTLSHQLAFLLDLPQISVGSGAEQIWPVTNHRFAQY